MEEEITRSKVNVLLKDHHFLTLAFCTSVCEYECVCVCVGEREKSLNIPTTKN